MKSRSILIYEKLSKIRINFFNQVSNNLTNKVSDKVKDKEYTQIRNQVVNQVTRVNEI